MEKDRKFRALAIAAICIAVVGVSVAYAALQASLSIEGTANVNTASSWKVAFGNPGAINASSGVTVVQEPTKSGDAKVTWEATFTAPGQSIEFTVPVNNTGSIDAALKSITKSIEGEAETVSLTTAEGTEPYQVFTYTVDVGSVTGVEEFNAFGNNTKLVNTNGTVNVKVKVVFDAAKRIDATTLTNLSGKSAKFTFGMEFGQAAGTEGTLGTAA